MNNKFFNFLGLAKRSGNLVEGYSKCDELRNKKRMHLFIISKDASESTKNKFINIGKDEIKILAILDKNMAKKLLSLYEEENICKN